MSRKLMHRLAAFLGLFLSIVPALQAQEYVRPAADLDRLVQELFAEIQSDQVPYEDVYETLLQYYQTPLNLNTATREELRSLLLLSEAQISALLHHREQVGMLLSMYELQSIDGFDLRSIYRVAPFATVLDGSVGGNRGPLWQRVLQEDNNALLVRYERVLQQRKGYTAPDTTSRLTSRYAGSPDKLLVRYRVSHAHDFSFGFTAEKDAGEAFSWNPGSRRYGADFYSAHFVVHERGRLKTLALGDYQLQFGQGLLLSSGFQVGKGAETITTIRRSNVGVRPYSSVLENSFFRGAAATFSLSKTLQATAFASWKKVDASIQTSTDSLAEFDEFSSGVLLTGLHRTTTELANRKDLRELISGGNFTYTSRNSNFSAGLTAVDTHFDKAILRRSEPYNAFEFRGMHNLAVSTHYSYVLHNALLFGETARSSGGGWGTVNGVLASLASNVDASVLYRRYTRDFHTFYGNALSENTRNINESGLYMGLKMRPLYKWEISAYYDQFRFPWLKYQIGAPSQGHDWLLRVAFSPSKTSLLYAQMRLRVKDHDGDLDPVRPVPVPTERRSVLLFYDANPSATLSLRTRLQGTHYRENDGPRRAGYVLAQDVTVAVVPSVQLSARYALFDTDDYDTRQYVFERDVLYAFSVPPLYGQGTRVYALAEVKCSRHLTLWLRYDETHYRHHTTIGSGLEEIQGPRRSQVKMQVRYKI
ncbi:helix-hairpin-helix domain-containing protein [Hymenobacter sp. BT491]|uniref:helix-hairpin-helix domain-containing protein n=1 Tax=Hymenobacter sp. BT491 TaxID=2766779 RepID=UPI0021CCC2EE|nr:helix-hairpin-helix domain-containing protein [Hymenobacter sp. BT491]